jgi:hypothetical protein
MTGGGRGYCVLRLPRSAHEPVEGFVGAAGRPVACFPHREHTEFAHLRYQARRIELAIEDLRRRLTGLEASWTRGTAGVQPGDCNATA